MNNEKYVVMNRSKVEEIHNLIEKTLKLHDDHVDFSSDILKDLVSQGFEGEELIKRFQEIKAEIPNALKRMSEEVRNQPAFSGGDLEAYLNSLDDDNDDD